MDRITRKQLDYLVEQINKATGSPVAAYTKTPDGRHKANIGNYHISCAYGGVQLHRMCNPGGGVSTVSHDGYGTKRELYSFMRAFLDGIAVTKE